MNSDSLEERTGCEWWWMTIYLAAQRQAGTNSMCTPSWATQLLILDRCTLDHLTMSCGCVCWRRHMPNWISLTRYVITLSAPLSQHNTRKHTTQPYTHAQHKIRANTTQHTQHTQHTHNTHNTHTQHTTHNTQHTIHTTHTTHTTHTHNHTFLQALTAGTLAESLTDMTGAPCTFINFTYENARAKLGVRDHIWKRVMAANALGHFLGCATKHLTKVPFIQKIERERERERDIYVVVFK